jgi:hypothetical protein
MSKFICAECGSRCHAHELSNESLDLANTSSHQVALGRLNPEERVCQVCAYEYAAVTDDEPNTWGGATYTAFIEREFGQVTDPGLLSTLRQNY